MLTTHGAYSHSVKTWKAEREGEREREVEVRYRNRGRREEKEMRRTESS
jgi:hypothetical protein